MHRQGTDIQIATGQRGKIECGVRQLTQTEHNADAEQRKAAMRLCRNGFPLRTHDKRDRGKRQTDKRRAEHINAAVKHLREHGCRQPHAEPPADAEPHKEPERLTAFDGIAPAERVQRADKFLIKSENERHRAARNTGHGIGKRHAEPAKCLDQHTASLLSGIVPR